MSVDRITPITTNPFSANSASLAIAQSFEKHPLYSEFKAVETTLAENGFVCWIAGGAVRDFLLNRNVADFDLVTDATTEQIMQLFPEALTVGASFGVVKLVLKDKSIFDLATFRRESDYVDGRRPSRVDYATPEEDAGRRDFTVNALFWDDQKKQIVDFTNGIQDLAAKILKCVGDAEVRFQEDHLRILRLLRFSVQLNFDFEPKTLQAALTRVHLLEKISGERIWAEFQKMIPSIKWNRFLQEPLALKIFDFIFNEIKNDKHYSADEATESNKKLGVNSGQDLDQLPEKDSLLKFFFVLIEMDAATNPNNDKLKHLKNILKSRLKVGGDDLKIFDALVFVYQSRNDSISFGEWALQVERDALILQALEFLNALKMFDSSLLKKITDIVGHWPAKLIDGNDLLSTLAKEKIGPALKEARKLQFENPKLTKTEILEKIMKL